MTADDLAPKAFQVRRECEGWWSDRQGHLAFIASRLLFDGLDISGEHAGDDVGARQEPWP
jgi:hypothetical protein